MRVQQIKANPYKTGHDRQSTIVEYGMTSITYCIALFSNKKQKRKYVEFFLYLIDPFFNKLALSNTPSTLKQPYINEFMTGSQSSWFAYVWIEV